MEKETHKKIESETEKKDKIENLVETSKEKKTKKTEAIVNGRNLPISLKKAMAVCNMIRNKELDASISKLELAEKMKIAVPMRGEIPHRRGMMSGRYPIKTIGEIIKLLKSLKANALVNELELEKYKIECKVNLATKPYRRFGQGQFKRAHVQIKLIPKGNKK